MEQPKNTSTVAISVTALITVIVVAGGVYYWQGNSPNNTETRQFETMEEYVNICIETEKSAPAPTQLVKVEFGPENPIDVKLPEASVPVFVYAEPDWDTGNLEDQQMFYLKSETPASFLEDPAAEKQDHWCGPYNGKLKLLVQ
jgi:hypothetical protein